MSDLTVSGCLLFLSYVEIGLHQHFLFTNLDQYDPPQLPIFLMLENITKPSMVISS